MADDNSTTTLPLSDPDPRKTFDDALAAASGRALLYEHQINDLEVALLFIPLQTLCSLSSQGKLTLDLSNSRAIENLLEEVFSGLQVRFLAPLVVPAPYLGAQLTQRRADKALKSTVPHTAHALDEDLAALHALHEHLPLVRDHVRDIRKVYDRGRDKVCIFPRRHCQVLMCVLNCDTSPRPTSSLPRSSGSTLPSPSASVPSSSLPTLP